MQNDIIQYGMRSKVYDMVNISTNATVQKDFVTTKSYI